MEEILKLWEFQCEFVSMLREGEWGRRKEEGEVLN